MSQQALPPGFEESDDKLPIGYSILFPNEDESGSDLTKITETPARMILPLVRMRVIDAASNPRRKTSLLEIFVQEFDRRMISKDRRGRIEAVQIMQGAARGDDEEDAAVL